MKLLCDEGVDRPIVEALRTAGYSVIYIAESEPGLVDEAVLERARAEKAVLVTLDKDFGELVFRQKLASAGILLLRVSGLTAAEKQRVVLTVLEAHGPEIQGSFTVVTPTNVRIRRPR